jgi:hypothetical protein
MTDGANNALLIEARNLLRTRRRLTQAHYEVVSASGDIPADAKAEMLSAHHDLTEAAKATGKRLSAWDYRYLKEHASGPAAAVSSNGARLTVTQLAEATGVAVRTIRRALAAGLKSYPVANSRERVIVKAEWDAWRNPAKVDAAVARAVVKADPDALASMRARLPELMALAEADYRAAREGEGSSSAVANAARTYATYSDAARRLEKELPEILYRKARYVDAEAVGATLGRAAAIVASELDQLGQAIAEKCEQQDARTIRGIIDDAVAGARLRLTEALQALCGPAQPGRQ